MRITRKLQFFALCIFSSAVKFELSLYLASDTVAGVRQFDEDTVFSQSLDIFWAKGYRATSMLDLAKETGVQRGSLYNAYGDKEEIFLRVFERYADRFIADARKALDKPDLRAALEAFFAFAVQSITKGSPSRGCLSTKLAVELDSDSGRQQEALKSMLDALEAALLDALASPGARSQLKISAVEAARVAVTMTRGIAVMERVHGDRKLLKEICNSFINTLLK
ncbi:TetR/AcrR family transcriptional regulator [Paraburkholderia sp. C35]|uniref:TetR/AcrR family transcriptional regulator n=1 Tax=Paraburkholderia sp. C35 TaxID=2126993 RepID=UPI001EF3E127|nr:TetR/AcrR family transcriptional regulator [Paraburkholderia sp. C35]